METALCNHLRRLPLIRSSSPLANHNHHPQQQQLQNTISGTIFDWRTLERIYQNQHHHRHRPKRVCVANQNTTTLTGTMAEEESNRKTIELAGESVSRLKEEAEKKPEKSPPLPPPPEKPLPGDCCGSGCVRCVWDIYYEELEAYDKLLQEQ